VEKLFLFEIYARHAKLHWEAGGSYGLKADALSDAAPTGPPEAKVTSFRGRPVLGIGISGLLKAIAEKSRPTATPKTLAALEIADKIYRLNGIS